MTEKFFTVKNLAEVLGVTQQTVYQQMRQNKLPSAIRVGRLYRWRPEAIEAWCKAQEGDISE